MRAMSPPPERRERSKRSTTSVSMPPMRATWVRTASMPSRRAVESARCSPTAWPGYRGSDGLRMCVVGSSPIALHHGALPCRTASFGMVPARLKLAGGSSRHPPSNAPSLISASTAPSSVSEIGSKADLRLGCSPSWRRAPAVVPSNWTAPAHSLPMGVLSRPNGLAETAPTRRRHSSRSTERSGSSPSSHVSTSGPTCGRARKGSDSDSGTASGQAR